jgi:hypothetical protein
MKITPIPVGEIMDRLPFPENIDAMAIALEEVCIAHAMVVIHGREHGPAKYIDLGGRMRSDDNGYPVLLWNPEMKSRL